MGVSQVFAVIGLGTHDGIPALGAGHSAWFDEERVWPGIERDGELIFEIDPGAAYTPHLRVD